MRIFYSKDITCVFLGACAVIVADNEAEAISLVSAELQGHGLKFDGTLIEIALDQPQAIVLNNGDY